MTTDIEKQFFDTFGIKPEYQNRCMAEDEYWDNEELANEYVTFERYMNSKCGNRDCTIECPYAYQNEIYPQITDHILLKLEAIIHNEYNILIYEKFMDSIKTTAYPMDDNLLCDPAYFAVMAQADNKREALLVLAMDINVQHYIKQQVRALFEGGVINE